MTTPTPADQLRAAAERARQVADPGYRAFARLLDGYATDWECCPADHPGTVLDEYALAVARQLLGTTEGEGAPAGEREPIQLRWGLDDVMYGDDDTTTVMLSGPSGEPYWVELGPERTAALRDALAGPAAPPAPTDRATTRDRIRRAICEASGSTWLPDEHADAVLAVLAGEAAAGAHHPTTTRSYRLEHRHLEESTWRPNTPGIGASWSWQSREKAAQRLAEVRTRWSAFEHRLIETTTTVASRVLPDCLACGHYRCDGDGPCGALLDAWQRCTCTATPPAAPAAPEEPTR
ncbi:hypothetical protein OG909_24860 [Streptomyces sp. NBC_01754]|uniref:hypothetical protein n=1 Tax=Streptomyces sp. NBC_01754 TaxID=2975930 RepID=UPI002DD7EE53|nr:hypothetical protein [Streptomyces sp. NBC_01754]WSC95247.1 hypothetical protein OG909_24860 [Streptomyces sp. NBC_01754]